MRRSRRVADHNSVALPTTSEPRTVAVYGAIDNGRIPAASAARPANGPKINEIWRQLFRHRSFSVRGRMMSCGHLGQRDNPDARGTHHRRAFLIDESRSHSFSDSAVHLAGMALGTYVPVSGRSLDGFQARTGPTCIGATAGRIQTLWYLASSTVVRRAWSTSEKCGFSGCSPNLLEFVLPSKFERWGK